MKTLVVSDLHLGNGGPYDIFAGAEALPALLAAEEPDRLIINGDGVDFLLNDDPIEGIDPGRAVAQAQAIATHSAAVLQAFGRVPEVVIRLGNHDLELALPAVQAVFRAAIAEGGEAQVRFVLGDETDPLIELNGVRVLVTHGEHDDVWNRLQYSRLRGRQEKFRYPPGSMLVKRGLNPFKAQLGVRFADLTKPDMRGGFLATALLHPGPVADTIKASLPGLTWAWTQARFGTPRTFADDEPETAVGTARWKGRMHQWVMGDHGARFFELSPTTAERAEASRLQEKYRCHAVLTGHTHAARFWAEGDLTYVNTGAWIPLVRAPDADDSEAAWTLFLDELRADPGMTGVAARYLKTRFTAAVVSPEKRGARIELVEWGDGGREVLAETVIDRGRRAPAYHQRPLGIMTRMCHPLVADEDGLALWREGAAPPTNEPPARALHAQSGFETLRGSDPNSVADMGWGIVVPAHRVDALKAAMAPLIALREGEMDNEVWVFTVDAGEARTVDAAQAWVDAHYRSLHAWDRPGFLLILGDLHEVPLALQRALSDDTQVGRLAFTHPGPERAPDLDAYAAYAEKVVRHQTARVDRKPDLVLYCVDDGTPATWLGNQKLVTPAAEYFESMPPRHQGFGSILRVPDAGFGHPSPEDLLDHPGLAGANVLLSVSHGVATTRDKDQRFASQGDMSFGRDRVTAADLRGGAFLPGGLWFYVACFGAGTPDVSDYSRWLNTMYPDSARAKRVLETLSPEPFVAALPQAALANPKGPLGVVGHVDLAWSFGLTEGVVRRTNLDPHRRFSDALMQLGMRRPTSEAPSFGLMLGEMGRVLRRFDTVLAAVATHGDAETRGSTWMARHDLDGYVLLGDPAARLPLGRLPD